MDWGVRPARPEDDDFVRRLAGGRLRLRRGARVRVIESGGERIG